MTQVKICGICRPRDAAIAQAAGAAYVGVILVPDRLRTRTVEEAQRIFAAAPGVRRVGVFADADVAYVKRVAEQLELDVIQLHGHEPPGYAAALDREVWRAVSVRSAADIPSGYDVLLLDGGAGGSGIAFDWSLVPPTRPYQLVLAGGLTPVNVAAAIRTARPDVVDVSSGVEATPGEKSESLIRAFVAAVHGAQE